MSNWNGKIKCIKNCGNFTVGRIYEINNGFIYDDKGNVDNFGYCNIKELNGIYYSQFEEVKDNKTNNWNGKVKCFKDNYFGFIKDTIYNVDSGSIVASNGRIFPESGNGYKYIDINDLNEDLCLMFEEVEENSSWNGNIKCIKAMSYDLTFGKIYEVKNGKFISDDEYQFGIFHNYNNIDELNNNLYSQFEEVKENNYVNQNKRCNSNVPKTDLPNKIPVLCELLGVQPNEFFIIKFADNYISGEYFISNQGFLFNTNGNLVNEYIPYLLNNKYQLIKLPFYSFNEDESITLKGLYLNGYYYIVKDKDSELWASEKLPEIGTKNYYLGGEYCLLNKDFFQQVQWGTILDIKVELDKIS